jgi:hypothetical protein
MPPLRYVRLHRDTLDQTDSPRFRRNGHTQGRLSTALYTARRPKRHPKFNLKTEVVHSVQLCEKDHTEGREDSLTAHISCELDEESMERVTVSWSLPYIRFDPLEGKS